MDEAKAMFRLMDTLVALVGSDDGYFLAGLADLDVTSLDRTVKRFARLAYLDRTEPWVAA